MLPPMPIYNVSSIVRLSAVERDFDSISAVWVHINILRQEICLIAPETYTQSHTMQVSMLGSIYY
jgi:hypothetical protein